MLGSQLGTDMTFRYTSPCNGQKKKGRKGQNIVDKILHKKLKIEQHYSYQNPGLQKGAPEGKQWNP
jgi:hypothetical protein